MENICGLAPAPLERKCETREVPQRSAAPRGNWPLTAATLDPSEPHCGPQERLPVLAVGAIGVVFGDIGTSPLYALKESFIGAHPLIADRAHIFGVLSLIFWTMVFVVTIKY